MRNITLRVLLLVVAFLLPCMAAAAQQVIQVSRNQIQVHFPDTVDFQLSARSNARIERINLRYGTNASSCLSGGSLQRIDFDAANDVTVNWEWELQRSGSLPPGAHLWWQWEIHDAAGNTHTTEQQEAIYDDGRYRWRSMSDVGVTVYWYVGDNSFGEQTLRNTIERLETIRQEMGVPVPEEVALWVYPNASDVRDALAITSEWAGAVAFSNYATMIISLEPGEDAWGQEVIAHELTHLAVGLAVFNCRGGYLPVWLNEGLAVYAEPEPDAAGLEDLAEALEANELPPLRSLADGFSAYGAGAGLAYSQSGEVVRYLVEAYGPEQMNALFTAVRQGNHIDRALEETYDFDTDGLDALWRQHQGFPATPTKVAASEERDATPTLVPTIALGAIPMVPTATPEDTETPLPPTSTPNATALPTDTATATMTIEPTDTPVTSIASASTPAPAPSPQPEVESASGPPPWLWGIIGIGVVMVALSAFFFLKRKQGA
jgi:hypothetical protein